MWLMKTRPDLLFTINLLARFLKCATAQHLKMAKSRVLRYLAGTPKHGVVFDPGSGEWKVSGWTDADLAGDLKTGRSTSGGAITLGETGNISSYSYLERNISTSTGLSETFAAVRLVKDLMWDRHVLSDLGYPQECDTAAYCDNDGVIAQSTKAINHNGVKHYRISQAFIKCVVADRHAKFLRVDSLLNPADMMTKALQPNVFLPHRDRIMGSRQTRPSM